MSLTSDIVHRRKKSLKLSFISPKSVLDFLLTRMILLLSIEKQQKLIHGKLYSNVMCFIPACYVNLFHGTGQM